MPEILSKQIDFLVEADKLKSVRRQALIKSDFNRRENSAEHSWHVSLAALTLFQYAPQSINQQRVLLMLLVHDMVEIEAGDTFAFADHATLSVQYEKEQQAAKQLFAILPRNQAEMFLQVWEEFEANETAEAQFAKAVDRIIPVFQNMQNEGGSWVRHQITKTQVLNRNKGLMEIAPTLWEYVEQQVQIAILKGWLINE